MKTTVLAAATVLFLSAGHAGAQQAEFLTAIPTGSATVANWYKQSVYDPTDAKIGEVSDVLIDPDGRVTTLILGVGNFLGVPDNDIAVPLSAVRISMRDGKRYLTMVTTKDALKIAPTFKYDKERTTWVR